MKTLADFIHATGSKTGKDFTKYLSPDLSRISIDEEDYEAINSLKTQGELAGEIKRTEFSKVENRLIEEAKSLGLEAHLEGLSKGQLTDKLLYLLKNIKGHEAALTDLKSKKENESSPEKKDKIEEIIKQREKEWSDKVLAAEEKASRDRKEFERKSLYNNIFLDLAAKETVLKDKNKVAKLVLGDLDAWILERKDKGVTIIEKDMCYDLVQFVQGEAFPYYENGKQITFKELKESLAGEYINKAPVIKQEFTNHFQNGGVEKSKLSKSQLAALGQL